MLGAKSALQARGVVVNAAVSRSWSAGVSVVRANPGYRVVVFHLGYNSYVNSSSCTSLIDALGGRRLVLLTIQLPEVDKYAYEDSNNAAIRACASRAGAALVDWNGATEGTTGLLARDGIHLTSAGAAKYTSLVMGGVGAVS